MGESQAVLTPSTGLTLAGEGERAIRAGTRWQLGADAALELEASRAAGADADADHAVILRGVFRF